MLMLIVIVLMLMLLPQILPGKSQVPLVHLLNQGGRLHRDGGLPLHASLLQLQLRPAGVHL